MKPEDGGQGLLVNLFYVLALGGDWNSLAWQDWQPDFKRRGNTMKH